MKNFNEVMQAFQAMPACDRLYLLCQMLQQCISYELVYIRNFLLGSVNDNSSLLTTHENSCNKIDHFTSFTSVSFDESLDKLICSLSLIHHDNTPMGEKIYNLLNNREILLKAEQIEDIELLNKLRLLYVLAVYHPVLTFAQKQQLLDVFLRYLDELHQTKIAEEERREEEDQLAALEEPPVMPSEGAYIISCDLKSVYKRQTDKRYPYILDVRWSDGACSVIHRTYGDFFTFQNKLLDIFPEESGQKNKKSRTIPFLPGKKLLSGRSNRELAEKRLPDLWQYTRDLFMLPEHITHCKHVLDFFKPRPSDTKEDGLSHQKVTTLSDIKNKIRNSSAVAFLTSSSPSSSPSRPHSTTILSSSLGGPSGRSSHTLPAQQSPGQPDKQATPFERRSTYPARPPQSAFTPVISKRNSSDKLHSNSQTSMASSNEMPATPPTTTACHVVTPPCNVLNGSPAFSLSRLSNSGNSSPIMTTNNKLTEHSSSPSIIKLVRSAKLKKASKSLDVLTSNDTEVAGINKKSSDTSLGTSGFELPLSISNNDSNLWADRSISPPKVDLSISPFPISTRPPSTSAVVMTTATSSMAPSSTTLTSNLAPPICHSKFTFSPSLPQLYPYVTPPHSNYPTSYTPTNFDSHSPKPHGVGGAKWLAGTPTCGTPISEAEHFKKWLKCHRLHKYEQLFRKMTFDEVSQLTADKMKEMGMTQGAAKKFNQKMSELVNSGVASFRDLPITNISRRPSTTSLPAALLLERQLTPSSSIDQLSLHGSTCSLDVLGHAYNTTPTHCRSESITDTVLNVDKAILETGPPTAINGSGKANRRSAPVNEMSGIITDGSHTPSKSGVANGASRHSTPNMPYWTPPTYSVTTPTDNMSAEDTRTYTPTHSYRQDTPLLPYVDTRLSPALLPTGGVANRGGVVTPNWTHSLGGTIVGPVIRGPVRGGVAPPILTYAPINGLVRTTGTPQRFPTRLPSCYKCGSRGHQGSHCPHNTNSSSGLMRS